ncbi:hypothetical protein Tco_0889175 [Tanacetum coccineum]
MLGEHNITYQPRTSIKRQILANFLVETPDEAPPDTSEVKTSQEPWTLFTDGSSCVDGSGVGLILTSLEGTEFTYEKSIQEKEVATVVEEDGPTWMTPIMETVVEEDGPTIRAGLPGSGIIRLTYGPFMMEL